MIQSLSGSWNCCLISNLSLALVELVVKLEVGLWSETGDFPFVASEKLCSLVLNYKTFQLNTLSHRALLWCKRRGWFALFWRSSFAICFKVGCIFSFLLSFGFLSFSVWGLTIVSHKNKTMKPLLELCRRAKEKLRYVNATCSGFSYLWRKG